MTLEEIRDEFPHTANTIYLNHAATAPLSSRVVAAMHAFIDRRHHGEIDFYFDFVPTIEETRRMLTDLIGAGAGCIEFVPSTTEALNLLANGLDWKPGDRIAIPGCEFPANVYPFMNLRRWGVEVDFIPHREGVFTTDDIRRTITDRTRLLSLSWVQFLSGYRIDLAEVGRICREAGVLFCVDAIQGLGALRLDVEEAGIDFLACGVQKWLMADQGLAFLYARGDIQDKIHPPAGYLHGPVDWENFLDYKLAFYGDARRFRQGTQNNLGIAALHAALKLYQEADPAACEARVLERASTLAEGLGQLGIERYGAFDGDHASGIVTVKHPRSADVAKHLKAHGIETSVRNRMLRFSPTWYNSEEEIARTLKVLSDFSS